MMNLIWKLLNKETRNNRYISIATILIATATAFGLLFSCASSTGTPEWLSSYPSDSAYYVGIGGSNTGNLAEDREKAAASARADLAAQISTQVRSELDIASSASSEGDFSESVKQTITESVDQNLQSVETVDTWISSEQGAWAYVRLSKAAWAAIVKQEVADLTLRANTTLQPVASGRMTESEEMAALGRAREQLAQSAWGPRVKDEVFSTGGFLKEAVDRAISERVAGLIMTVSAQPLSVEYGNDVVLQGSVVSGLERGTGSFPLILKTPDGNKEYFNTNSEGFFNLTRNSGALGLENLTIVVSPDLGYWGIPIEGFPVTDASVNLYIAPVPVSFSIDSDNNPDLAGLHGAVFDWFSDLDLPVTVVSSGAESISIDFAWTSNDYPRSQRLANAPYISEVSAIITLRQGSNIVSVLNLEAFKDGGLDWEQAHKRAAQGLLNDPDRAEDLALDLFDILGK